MIAVLNGMQEQPFVHLAVGFVDWQMICFAAASTEAPMATSHSSAEQRRLLLPTCRHVGGAARQCKGHLRFKI